eukprot:6312419-Karenia_brevis.AAC.1
MSCSLCILGAALRQTLWMEDKLDVDVKDTDMGDATTVDTVSATSTIPEMDEAARQKASMAD